MDPKIQAILNAVVEQRNASQNQVAELLGEVADRDAKIKVLEAKLEEKKEDKPE